MRELGAIQAGRQRSPHFIKGTMRPYLRVANVFDGYIDPSDVLQMCFTDKEYKIYKLQYGDILLNEGQSLELVGRSAMYRGNPSNCCFQNTLIRFRAGTDIIPEFALATFQYYMYSGRFATIASQTTSVAHLGVSRFANLDILLPSLPEQHSITNVLSIWDQAINLTTQLITAKEQHKRGLMQRLLTGRLRFKRFIDTEQTQDTAIGRIPVDWNYVSLGSISQQVSKRNTEGLNLPVLSCTKYAGLVDSLSYFGKQVFSKDTSAYKVVQRGQFAYATNHIEEGSIGYQDLYNNALISPMYTVFETNSAVDDRYLYALLKTETYRQIFESSTSASVDRRGSLRWNDFSRIKVPLPSLSEQQAIADVLDACNNELALLNRKLALLKKQKQGLMQQLLTGKVRVKT